MNKFLVVFLTFAVSGFAAASKDEQSPFSTVDFDHYWTLDEVGFAGMWCVVHVTVCFIDFCLYARIG